MLLYIPICLSLSSVWGSKLSDREIVDEFRSRSLQVLSVLREISERVPSGFRTEALVPSEYTHSLIDPITNFEALDYLHMEVFRGIVEYPGLYRAAEICMDILGTLSSKRYTVLRTLPEMAGPEVFELWVLEHDKWTTLLRETDKIQYRSRTDSRPALLTDAQRQSLDTLMSASSNLFPEIQRMVSVDIEPKLAKVMVEYVIDRAEEALGSNHIAIRQYIDKNTLATMAQIQSLADLLSLPRDEIHEQADDEKLISILDRMWIDVGKYVSGDMDLVEFAKRQLNNQIERARVMRLVDIHKLASQQDRLLQDFTVGVWRAYNRQYNNDGTVSNIDHSSTWKKMFPDFDTRVREYIENIGLSLADVQALDSARSKITM